MGFWKGFSGKAGIAAVGASVLAFGQSAWAQGCVLCYTSASALNKNAAHELDKAIIELFVPPALIFVGIFVYIYKRRNAWRTAEHEEAFSGFGHGAQFEAPGRTRF